MSPVGFLRSRLGGIAGRIRIACITCASCGHSDAFAGSYAYVKGRKSGRREDEKSSEHGLGGRVGGCGRTDSPFFGDRRFGKFFFPRTKTLFLMNTSVRTRLPSRNDRVVPRGRGGEETDVAGRGPSFEIQGRSSSREMRVTRRILHVARRGLRRQATYFRCAGTKWRTAARDNCASIISPGFRSTLVSRLTD